MHRKKNIGSYQRKTFWNSTFETFNLIKHLYLSSYFCSVIIVLMLTQNSSAQTGYTPTSPGNASGSPVGAYPLSGLETVNLYNGQLNLNLPLLQVNGRGTAGYAIQVPLQTHRWKVATETRTTPNGTLEYSSFPEGAGGASLLWDPYAPGMMRGQTAIDGAYSFSPISLTRFAFRTADGTENEFRDQLTDGKPYVCSNPPNCSTPFSRGTVFKTADGTGMIFISDTEIRDEIREGVIGGFYGLSYLPSGIIIMRDGTRYRIDGGNVSWIQDRNGNKIEFTYGTTTYGTPDRLFRIKDSLNREVTITYGDRSANEWYDQITYKGFGDATRTVKVWYKRLQHALRPDQTLKTKKQLFPSLNGVAQDTHWLYNPIVISSVTLPNNKEYTFSYNSYVELARVVLPTGGIIDYNYTGLNQPDPPNPSFIPDDTGVVYPNSSGCAIYRRLSARRTLTSENQPESSVTYSDVGFLNPVEVSHFDQNDSLQLKEKHFFHSNAPLFPGPISPVGYANWIEGKEYRTELVDAAGNLLRRVEHNWQLKARVSWYAGTEYPIGYYSFEPVNEPRITETINTLADSNQVSKQTFSYDEFNNQTDVYEYDLGPNVAGALLLHTHTEYANSVNLINGLDYTTNSIHMLSLPVKQQLFNAAGAEMARTTYEYDNYTDTANHAALVPRSNISGLNSAYTASYLTRGNVTAITHWLLPNTPLTTYHQYDVAGNAVKGIDARGKTTEIIFDDNFGSPDGEARSTTPPQELASLSQASYAFPTRVTNQLGHVIRTQYDYHLGKPIDAEDANEVVSSSFYSDSLDRLKQVVRAANQNASVKNQTTYTYEDTNHNITTTSDLNSLGDNLLKSLIVYDGFGRTTESRQYETVTSYIATQQVYDAFGRVKKSTNPFRPGDTVYWTTAEYDALGRVTSVTTPDNAVVQTQYRGNLTLVTDQAARKRLSRANALGQLSDVWEIAPSDSNTVTVTFGPQSLEGYLTHYDYDPLNNLTKVTQGTQIRTFLYDSLSRLILARVPELDATLTDTRAAGSWSLSYEYDGNGNLKVRKDARSVTTTYEYDDLNRLKLIDYSGPTPDVTYIYDTLAYGKGRLASVSNSVSLTSYTGYDPLGRITGSSQTTGGITYTFPEYKYDLAGNLTQQTYPSGRVITTNHDNAGRISSLSGVKPSEASKTYADSFSYLAHGATGALRLGNNLWEHVSYNSRLQPTEIGLGVSSTDSSTLRLVYSYSTTNNNGNVQSQEITAPGLTLTQSYTYDQLNRLKTFSETGGLSQTYEYDRYGNRAVIAGYIRTPTITPTLQSLTAFSQTNNRIVNAGYDEAGNLLNAVQGHGFSYDAENRLTSHDDAQSVGMVDDQYSYDGDGRRVKKVNGSVTTIFVYNVLGQMVAEYTDYNPPQAALTSYFTADSLGTPRVITNQQGGVISRHDYLPFGEEIKANTGGRTAAQGYIEDADGISQKFTGKERDVETELDYFAARYYASSQGRFTSPDPMLSSGKPGEPQSWNRYTYALNNPLRFADPSGLDPTTLWGYRIYTGSDGQSYIQFGYLTGEWRNGVLYDDLGQRWDRWEGGSYYVYGDNTAAHLGPEGNYFRFSLAGLPEEMRESLAATQLADGNFSIEQMAALQRATADEYSKSFDFAVKKGIAGIAGGWGGGAGAASRFTFGAAGRQATRLPPVLFYYTDDATAIAIQNSQLGLPGRQLFLTDRNLSPAMARELLALPEYNTGTAMFAVDTQALRGFQFTRGFVTPANNRLGGGVEFIFDRTVPLQQGGSRYVIRIR